MSLPRDDETNYTNFEITGFYTDSRNKIPSIGDESRCPSPRRIYL
ncbi:hypothetical protein [Helicobacter mastomyrinus]|uniref:Uncharacterized protein n=1 Tax=Helicobacter mastomyrinus TaxID=287948 RepID=A0ABZ3F9F0_9HELI|nr:hypothetical protein [uncultured Helicobacter sp.]